MDAYWKIFSFKRSESVKKPEYFCGDLLLEYLYDLFSVQFLFQHAWQKYVLGLCPEIV